MNTRTRDDVAAIVTTFAELAASHNAETIKTLQADIRRLRAIEFAARRVMKSRRDGIVTDQRPLDALEAALERHS